MTTSYSIENYSKFNDVNQEVRAHWQLGREAARNVSIKLNELVSILHKENPDWSVNKIAHAIWAANEDLDGFAKDTIYTNLNQDNRALLGYSGRRKLENKVTEQSFRNSETNVLEESSMIYHDDEDEKPITEIDETVDNVDDIQDWTKKD